MKFLVSLVRLLVGGLFIFSGFVKTIDPIGFGYKLEEYFSPDVFNLGFLEPLALPLSIFFVILEVMLGVFLILGIFKRFTIGWLIGLIVFFTFLTFYSAYFNKVTDCGCFGDAIKLTPWESFYKDIILLVLILFLTWKQKFITPWVNAKVGAAFSLLVFLGLGFVVWHGLYRLPLIDFRPFAVGKSIPEGMKSAEELGLTPPKYEVFYEMVNQETGEEVTISSEEYVNNTDYQNETLWVINPEKEPETKKMADGYEPPINADFYLDCSGEDKTQEYLSSHKVVMFILYKPEISEQMIGSMEWLAHKKYENDDVVVLANQYEIEGLNLPICTVDTKMLKTIVRSHGGLVILEEGVITHKEHYQSWILEIP